jgi:hypothetical protein
MLVRTATDAVLVRADHADAQFVENLKSCLSAVRLTSWSR